jgi:rod shape-determining protein MreC
VRNLILLIKQYYNFFVFLFLQIICWILVFSNNTVHQSSYLNSSRSIAGSLYQQQSRFLGFLSLRSVNDSLVKENALLRSKLGLAVPANPLRDTSYTRSDEKDSMRTTIFYNYIPARVLNNTIDQKRNYITINKGSAEGIKVKMAVISDKGIVGRVSHVTTHYAVVSSVLSDQSQVSAQVPDGTVGRVVWDSQNPTIATLRGIPQSVTLKKGDSVTTSGYSYFPEGILVGRVWKKNKSDYTLSLATLFHNLHYVYVIEDNTRIERFLFEDSVTQIDAP